MSKKKDKVFIAFGDAHYPHHNPVAIDILKQAIMRLKPDLVVSLGDLLDCGQFSTHPPTFGVKESDYEEDLRQVNELLDFCQKYAKERLILVEGNHEIRLDRWAAAHAEGRGTYSMLAPRIQLMKTVKGRPRTKCTYIPYGSANGKYPHYKLNNRLVAVHGWSYARHATKKHLEKSQGKSVIHGHCLPVDYEVLTLDGWKKVSDVGKSDIVKGYYNGQMVCADVLCSVYHENWSGRMAVFGHEAISQTMTELHGIYTADDRYLHVRDALDVPVSDLVQLDDDGDLLEYRCRYNQTLGDIVEWVDVEGVDTACIQTSTRNFVCRTTEGRVELTGNTHRVDTSVFPNVWGTGTINASSAGCMCKPIPMYGTGTPVEWVNAFIIGYMGRQSDTLYTVDIKGDFAILPDGTRITSRIQP